MNSLKTESREELKAEYRAFLKRQRGLTDRTAYKYGTFVDRFLDFKFGKNPDELSQITGYDVADFLHHLVDRPQPLRDKTLATNMRSFFRFLFQTEKINLNLAVGVPGVAQKYSRRIPHHLTPEQVEILLEVGRNLSNSICKKRNYAMVILMARLGLRATEIVSIQLEDIDWRSGEIIIRGKGKLHDKAPMLQDVGEAIADYIQHERKSTSRYLFVRSRTPYQHFGDAQIINKVLKEAFAMTNIPKPKRYTVSNILRHSLATNLVQRGASLEEISNTLRHRSRKTTMIYARQDIDGLRTIAQPWPLVEGGQL